MAMKPEHRATLIASTQGAAAAFVEDMAHLREVVARTDPLRDELRRMSGILRRLLIDGDLALVAAPRIGKILLRAPQNNPAYRIPQRIHFFQSGGYTAYGIYLRGFMMGFGDGPAFAGTKAQRWTEEDIYLRIDNFLSQRVFCLDGLWLSRREVIKYVANFGSGVHSTGPETEAEKALDRIHHFLLNFIDTESPEAKEAPGGMIVRRQQMDFDNLFDPKAIPPTPLLRSVSNVLLELLAAAHFLVTSPSVIDLEKVVLAELGQA